jgi:NTE family protein
MARPKIGLALGGGGARGLAHIGVLQALEEAKIPVDFVAGVSIGAIVGALYAHFLDSVKVRDHMKTFVAGESFRSLGFHKLESSSSYEPSFIEQFSKMVARRIIIRLNATRLGLITAQRMHRVLSELYDGMSFSSLKIPFGALAGNLETGEGRLFIDGDLVTAVQASASLPGWVEPLLIDGEYYADGIVFASVPTNCLRDMGADIVIAVDVTNRKYNAKILKNSIDVVSRSEHIIKNRLTDMVLGFADLIIQPDTKGLEWYEYSRIDELLYEGREAMRMRRHELQRLIQ